MANLIEANQWPAGIYQIETQDPVLGGPPDLPQAKGIANVAVQQLADRTVFLKARLDSLLNDAPEALDTIKEIAGALGNDSNLAGTIATQLANARQQSIRDAYPVGMPVKSYHNTPDVPSEVVALELNRAAISRATYADLWAKVQTSGRYDATGASEAAYGPGDGSTTFQLFDARGEFERGLDNGRGVDAGRGLGDWQQYEIQPHDHGMALTRTSGAGTVSNLNHVPGNTSTPLGAQRWVTDSAGSVETRPRNIAVRYFIVAGYNFGA